MNAAAAFWLVFSLASTGAVASPWWPVSLDWTAIPSPVADASCANRSGRRGGFDSLARGASASKKKPSSAECLGGVAQGHGGRRPRLRTEVDSSLAPQTPEGPAPPWHSAG